MHEEFSKDFVEISLKDNIKFLIYIESKKSDNSLVELTADLVSENSEESIQLMEGYSYNYELPEDYEIKSDSKIVIPHVRQNNRGRITPGIYVGRLEIKVLYNKFYFDTIGLEVRSRKADYRTEYRKMLEDITTECTELLMIHSSPVTQRFTVDHNTDSKTIYQRFAFVKSIVDSNEFRNAIHRVISMPVTTWSYRTEQRDIRRVGRISGSSLRQIASGSNRLNLPVNHPLRRTVGLETVPTRLTTTVKIDTVDTPENRFVKHAVSEFKQFCSMVVTVIEKSNKRPSVYYEALGLEETLGEYLNHSVFKEISNPTSLPLNSPVLQRKEGYREILRVWLMFDLAAKLTWKALDEDSYHVGKRDVATLYEYWLFFKLLNLVKNIFKIESNESDKLISLTKTGLDIQLKSGNHVAFEGLYEHKNRSLKVKYSYNRTFNSSEYPLSGSWTQQMRPDYTLSFWPSEFEEDEAEEQELIVHIHFDAKYKVEGLKYLTNTGYDSKDDIDEKKLEKEGRYKRGDLLKMHAYKDAIRRTAGAYVLYPGSKTYKRKGFHEIIPGLGAFPVSPSNNGEGLDSVKSFILSVLDHLCNRASRREELTYHMYKLNDKNQRADIRLFEKIPEKYNGKRTEPVTQSSVLVGYYKDKNHLNWIIDNKKYNIRMSKNGGLLKYSQSELEADYLLLHTKDEPLTGQLWKIISKYPELKSRNDLTKLKYPSEPSCEYYFIYELEPIQNSIFNHMKWDIRQLNSCIIGYQPVRPYSIRLEDFIKFRTS